MDTRCENVYVFLYFVNAASGIKQSAKQEFFGKHFRDRQMEMRKKIYDYRNKDDEL